jgi:hypothetical protein
LNAAKLDRARELWVDRARGNPQLHTARFVLFARPQNSRPPAQRVPLQFDGRQRSLSPVGMRDPTQAFWHEIPRLNARLVIETAGQAAQLIELLQQVNRRSIVHEHMVVLQQEYIPSVRPVEQMEPQGVPLGRIVRDRQQLLGTRHDLLGIV